MIEGPAEIWAACPEAALDDASAPPGLGLREADAYRVDCNHVFVDDGVTVPLTRAGLAAAGIREPPAYYVPKRDRDGAHIKREPHLHVRRYGQNGQGTDPGLGAAWMELPYPDARLQDLPTDLMNGAILAHLDCNSLASLCRAYKCDTAGLERLIGLHGLPLELNGRELRPGSPERVRLACALELSALRLDLIKPRPIIVRVNLNDNVVVVSWEEDDSGARYWVDIARSRDTRRVMSRRWFRNGWQHRDGGLPAEEIFFDVDGDEARRILMRKWYQNERLHRDGNLPAEERFYDVDGDEARRIRARAFYRNGEKHRDGNLPAVEKFFNVGGDESRRISDRGFYRGGEFHSDGDLPSVERFFNVDGDEARRIRERWFHHEGSLHREGDQPAMVEFFNTGGTESRRIKQRGFLQQGQFHRDGDLPAMEKFFDVAGDYGRRIQKRAFYQDGVLHRGGDSPATEEFYNVDGDEGRRVALQEWVHFDQRHRLAGPARVMYANVSGTASTRINSQEWYEWGVMKRHQTVFVDGNVLDQWYGE